MTEREKYDAVATTYTDDDGDFCVYRSSEKFNSINIDDVIMSFRRWAKGHNTVIDNGGFSDCE